METTFKLISFVSFYIGQTCYNEEDMPDKLRMTELMIGLEGILDLSINIANDFLSRQDENFTYDTEEYPNLEVDIINCINEYIK